MRIHQSRRKCLVLELYLLYLCGAYLWRQYSCIYNWIAAAEAGAHLIRRHRGVPKQGVESTQISHLTRAIGRVSLSTPHPLIQTLFMTRSRLRFLSQALKLEEASCPLNPNILSSSSSLAKSPDSWPDGTSEPFLDCHGASLGASREKRRRESEGRIKDFLSAFLDLNIKFHIKYFQKKNIHASLEALLFNSYFLKMEWIAWRIFWNNEPIVFSWRELMCESNCCQKLTCQR